MVSKGILQRFLLRFQLVKA